MGGTRGSLCWGGGSATGATSVPSHGRSQQDAVSPVSSSPAGTHEVCPQGRVGTGDGPCPQDPHRARDGITGTVPPHPLPSPPHASCHQTLLAFWDVPYGDQGHGAL